MSVEREYEVAEPVVAANYFRVRARSKAEAIEKVRDQEQIEAWQGDVYPDPRRRMTARRVTD